MCCECTCTRVSCVLYVRMCACIRTSYVCVVCVCIAECVLVFVHTCSVCVYVCLFPQYFLGDGAALPGCLVDHLAGTQTPCAEPHIQTEQPSQGQHGGGLRR